MDGDSAIGETLVAAEDLGDKLLRIASDELETALEDLELRDGAAQVRGVPDRALAIGDIVRVAMKKGGVPVGVGTLSGSTTEFDDHCVRHSTYPAFNEPSFAAHAAEVEVDLETGRVARRFTAAAV